MSFFGKPKITIEKLPGDPLLPVVHILHGIHSNSRSPGILAPYYTEQDFRVWLWDYGHIFALNARFFKNPYVVDAVLAHTKPGDIGVGHSNGCAILARACDEGAGFSQLSFINPALNKSRRLNCNQHLKHIRVYYNRGDTAVLAGKWLRWLDPVSLIKKHPYGEMGRVGPNYSDDPRMLAVSGDDDRPAGLPPLHGHSALLHPSAAASWGRWDAAHTALQAR